MNTLILFNKLQRIQRRFQSFGIISFLRQRFTHTTKYDYLSPGEL